MENQQKRNLAEHGVTAEAVWTQDYLSEQEKLCNEYTGLLNQACWHGLAYMIVHISKDNIQESQEFCFRAPEENSRVKCYLNAISIIVRDSAFNSADSRLLCSPYQENSELYESCNKWILERLIYSSEEFENRAREYCKNVIESYRETCFRELKKIRDSKSN